MAGVRITGRFGTLTLAGSAVAELVDWTLTVDAEVARCGIKGETIEPAAVGGLQMQLTAERIMTNSGGATLVKALLDHYGGAGSPVGTYGPGTPAGPPGVEKSFILDTGAGGSVISGAGVVTRARVNAPRDLSRDNFEMTATSLTSVT